jgi:hypothetical protein
MQQQTEDQGHLKVPVSAFHHLGKLAEVAVLQNVAQNAVCPWVVLSFQHLFTDFNEFLDGQAPVTQPGFQ